MILSQLNTQREKELCAAAESHNELQLLKARLAECIASQQAQQLHYTRLSTEHAEALNAAVSAASRAHTQHEEEVACLSQKIVQLEEELRQASSAQAHLQALCEQQASDIEILMQAAL